MKTKLSAVLALALIAVIISVSAPESTLTQTYPTFTSLHDDPMIPGGITGSLLQQYINDGYQLLYTTSDVPDAVIEFRNQSTGLGEWRIGTVPNGTPYLKHPVSEHVIFTYCGNDFAPDLTHIRI